MRPQGPTDMATPLGQRGRDGSVAPSGLRRFLTMVWSVLVVLHLYIGWRLLPDMTPGPWGWALGVVYLAVSTLMLPLGLGARFLIRSHPLADRVGAIGSLLMGLFSSLLVLTVLRDLLLGGLLLAVPGTVLAAWRDHTAPLVPLLALLVTAVGYVNARRIPRVARVSIPIADLPQALQGFTIAQITDLHVGPTIKRGYVAGVVQRLNALQPDLIAVTGDLVDGKVEHLRADMQPLAELRARHGVYAVTGNHEYYSGAAAWVAEFRRLGMRVLMNEHTVVEHHGAQLVVAGVTDFSAGRFDPDQASDAAQALAGAPVTATPKVLLAHQPRSAAAAAQAGFDLQLSGHTHGGQFWPWSLAVPLQQPYTAGLHRLGRMWIYTSRGTGYWGPPKRFGAPSEITLLQLEAAA